MTLNNPVHVGIDGTTWRNPRGFGRFTRELVAELAERPSRFRYSLILDAEPTQPVPENVNTVIAAPNKETASRFDMDRAARRLGCDLFFYPTVYSFFPMFSRVPKVVVIHDTIPERFPDLVFPTKFNKMLWKAKMTLAKLQATRFITCSESSIEDLHTILGISKSKIDSSTMAAASVFQKIDDPTSAAEIRGEFDLPETAKILVYVGGFNRHKNVIRLIEALPQIAAAAPDAFLAIVGRTTGERFWDNVEDLRETVKADAVASKSVIFTGEISDAKLAQLINAAHALVHPALYEGFGFPPVEAMACGTPVLGSNASSIPEVVGDAGLLFDPTDPDDIAAKTVQLLLDDSLRETLAARAQSQAAKFSWERAAETTEISFNNALKQRRN